MMLWVLLACSGEEKSKQDTASTIENTIAWRELSIYEAGPFQIGHKHIEHTYRPLADQEERTISIEVWYPTEDMDGETAEYFFGTDEESFSNAIPAPPIHEEGYPVHISSHGYQGWGANSTFLMRHFASHGWVVIAPNHINNTIVDHQSPLPVNHFIHRPMDITQSLNLLENGQITLAGNINTNKVVLSGHSFGASYSAWSSAGASYENIDAVCLEGIGLEDSSALCSNSEYEALSSGSLHDLRVQVAIPMAGHDRKSYFGEEGYKSVHASVLFVSGTNDNEEGNQAHYDDVEEIDFRWLSLEGGCHLSFSTGGCPTMENQVGFDILTAYLLGYARQRLLDDDNIEISDLLDGRSQPWSEATLLVKE